MADDRERLQKLRRLRELRDKAASTPPGPLSGLPENSALERASNPAMGMSALERGAAGFQKGVLDLGVAAGQILGGQNTAFGRAMGFLTPEQVAERREREKSLMSTGAGVVGNVVGNIVPFLPAMVVPGLATVRGAAATGAVAGALQPTVSGESRIGNALLGGTIGAAFTGAIKGGGNLFRKGRDIVQSYTNPAMASGRALDEAAGSRRDAIIRALRANRTPNISAGEASAPAGSAEFAALQRIADDVNPSGLFARRSAQAGNRTSRLAEALQTDKLDDFVSARKSVTDPMYAAIEGNSAKVDVSDVVSAVNDIIKKNQNRTALTSALRSILDKLTPSTKPTRISISRAQNQPTKVPVTVGQMKSLVDELGDIMSKRPPTGQPLNESVVRQLVTVKNMLDDQIRAASPAYGEAVDTYAQMSGPVNRARIGRALIEALDPPISDLGAEMGQRSTSYAQAVRSSAGTGKKATGFGRTSIEEIVTPEQMQTIREVGEELANLANFEKLASLGSKAGREIVSGIAPEKLPGILERNVVIANSILGRSGKTATRKILEYLAANMDDPQTIASIMENASPQVAEQVNQILSILRQSMSVGAASAGTEHG